MFRGIEKDIIIVAPLRNSSVSGLGQLGDFIKLAMTRSRQYLWVVGASVTLIGQDSPGALNWTRFSRFCQSISTRGSPNYLQFSHFSEWKHDNGLYKILRQFTQEQQRVPS